MITGEVSKERVKEVYRQMENPDGELRFLFVTPEKLAKSKLFMNKLEVLLLLIASNCFERKYIKEIDLQE